MEENNTITTIKLTNGFREINQSKDEIATMINNAISSNTLLIYVSANVLKVEYEGLEQKTSFAEECFYLNINHIIEF